MTAVNHHNNNIYDVQGIRSCAPAETAKAGTTRGNSFFFLVGHPRSLTLSLYHSPNAYTHAPTHTPHRADVGAQEVPADDAHAPVPFAARGHIHRVQCGDDHDDRCCCSFTHGIAAAAPPPPPLGMYHKIPVSSASVHVLCESLSSSYLYSYNSKTKAIATTPLPPPPRFSVNPSYPSVGQVHLARTHLAATHVDEQ